MAPKHTVDTINQGSFFDQPVRHDGAMTLDPKAPVEQIEGVYFSVEQPVEETIAEGGHFKPVVTERGERLTSLLKTMDLLSRINSNGGLEQLNGGNSNRHKRRAETIGGEGALHVISENAVNKIPVHEANARKAFEHATSHDQRLERMPADQAKAITNHAYANLKNKYYSAQTPKASAKKRAVLRKKLNSLIAAELQ